MANAYTDNEQNDLEKYKQIRNDIIDDMVKHGVNDNRDRRLLNEILSAAEKNIHDTANNRLKHQDNLNKEMLAEQVAMILKETHRLQTQVPTDYQRDVELNDDVIELDLVPGETEIHPEPLSLSEFITEDEKD